MAPQAGAHCFEKENGGRGVLLGGVPGVRPADVLVLGSGVVGTNAALIALGMGADVIIASHHLDSLRRASAQLGPRLRTVFSAPQAIETLCRRADLVIGAVLVPGGKAPKLISAATVKAMKQGAVIVDVSIDQGGIAEPPGRPPIRIHLYRGRRGALLRRLTCPAPWPVPRPSRCQARRRPSRWSLRTKATSRA